MSMKLMQQTATVLAVLVSSIVVWPTSGHAQTLMERPIVRDTLNLDATVNTQVVPDMAFVTMSVEKQGAEAPTLTNEVNQILAAALKEAKATAGVQAATANYNTWPRYDNRGQRNGWVVRAEMIMKSRDFGVLGRLAGKLSTTMNIQQNGFEVSPELKQQEEQKLIEQGLAAFRAKANAAVKALGYSSFSIGQVSLGSAFIGGQPGPRPMMSMAKAQMAEAAPMPIESGNTTLSLTVTGSVLMK
jgi:predicted secreted protein